MAGAFSTDFLLHSLQEDKTTKQSTSKTWNGLIMGLSGGFGTYPLLQLPLIFSKVQTELSPIAQFYDD